LAISPHLRLGCGDISALLRVWASWQSSTLSFEVFLSPTRVHFGASIAKNRSIVCSCSEIHGLAMIPDVGRALYSYAGPLVRFNGKESLVGQNCSFYESNALLLCDCFTDVSGFFHFLLTITSSIDQQAKAEAIAHHTFNKCPALF
jgi:hypothetical protein